MRYWDVFPKHIKVSKSTTSQTVPLCIAGTLVGAPLFISTDNSIAAVDSNGMVSLGSKVGATMISVYDFTLNGQSSLRHIQVEVIAPEEPQAVWLSWEES